MRTDGLGVCVWGGVLAVPPYTPDVSPVPPHDVPLYHPMLTVHVGEDGKRAAPA